MASSAAAPKNIGDIDVLPEIGVVVETSIVSFAWQAAAATLHTTLPLFPDQCTHDRIRNMDSIPAHKTPSRALFEGCWQ